MHLCYQRDFANHTPQHELSHSSFIIELLPTVLQNNYFVLNGHHYHQLSGTAVGSKLALSYANMFMARYKMLHVHTYPLQTDSGKGSLLIYSSYGPVVPTI